MNSKLLNKKLSTLSEANDSEEEAIKTILPKRREGHVVEELLFASARQNWKQKQSKDNLEILPIRDCLGYF